VKCAGARLGTDEITRSPDRPIFRSVLAAALLISSALSLEAQIGPPEIEEASDFARRAAKAAISGPGRMFAEALDIDGMLARRLGSTTWRGLTERQREQLRTLVRDHFLQSLASARSEPGELTWTSAAPSPTRNGVDVLIGLQFGQRRLKTRWEVQGAGGGWRVFDVVLSDPGISLADASVRALGPEPVRRRERRREAERVAYPRLAALGTIALLLAIITPRIERGKRKLLWLTAAAPAALFAIDGTLAVRRTLSEAYAVGPTASREPWREAEEQALQAEREEHWAQARDLWARAIAAGGAAGPIHYQLGLRARQLGDLVKARADFTRALSAQPPAPGAAKELATLDAAEKKFELAQQELERYIALAGPDPDALTLLAVLKTNLGKGEAGVDAVRRARDLVGEAWRSVELEAQVRASAGDAAGAVAALRKLEPEGRLDRSALRADAFYLPIANDPAWVAFINEKPISAPTPSRGKETSR
jgi:hypothetical protein